MARSPLFIQGYRGFSGILFQKNDHQPQKILLPCDQGSKVLDLFLLNRGKEDVVVEFGYASFFDRDIGLRYLFPKVSPRETWGLGAARGRALGIPGFSRLCLFSKKEPAFRGDFKIVKAEEDRLYLDPPVRHWKNRIFLTVWQFEVLWSVKVLKGAGVKSPPQNALDPQQLPWLLNDSAPFILKKPLMARLPDNAQGTQGDVIFYGKMGDYGTKYPLSKYYSF